MPHTEQHDRPGHLALGAGAVTWETPAAVPRRPSSAAKPMLIPKPSAATATATSASSVQVCSIVGRDARPARRIGVSAGRAPLPMNCDRLRRPAPKIVTMIAPSATL